MKSGQTHVEILEEQLAFAEAGMDYYRSGHLQNGKRNPGRPKFVPARIRLEETVRGDGPFAGTMAPPGEYACFCNQWGAASVIATNGEKLGVKLDEFEVIEWRENPEPNHAA